MSAVIDFLTRLVSDAIEMPQIFVEDVLLADPLNAINVLFGSVFIGLAVIAFGYVVVGALIQSIGGGGLPSPGRGPAE
ncbi:MAG: hypothetical protein ACQETB_01355 [Halobacteriota archaeon]